MERRITLLFSGGIDSTISAIKLAKTYDIVDLVSYWNGYGHYRVYRTKKRAKELSRLFPNKFRYFFAPVKDQFELLLISSIWEDYRRYNSGFIWCMGCKIAMHARTVVYNLENRICEVADGSSADSAEMVEQTTFSIAKIRDFYNQYGISYINPVYEQKREDSISELKRLGLKMGIRIKDRFLGIQPKCRPGELYYLPLILLGTPMDHAESKVSEFIDSKLALARKWIAQYCDERGIKTNRM